MQLFFGADVAETVAIRYRYVVQAKNAEEAREKLESGETKDATQRVLETEVLNREIVGGAVWNVGKGHSR